MAFDLLDHVRARSRSIAVDRTAVARAILTSPTDYSTQNSDTRRHSSVPLGQMNRSTSPVASPPATVRHYRSMLEVEEPPKLSPWKPLSFDELYANPIHDAANPEHTHSNPETRMEPKEERQNNSEHQTMYSSSQDHPCASASKPILLTRQLFGTRADHLNSFPRQ